MEESQAVARVQAVGPEHEHPLHCRSPSLSKSTCSRHLKKKKVLSISLPIFHLLPLPREQSGNSGLWGERREGAAREEATTSSKVCTDTGVHT